MKGLLAAQHIHRFDLVAHGSAAWIALEILTYDYSNVRRLALITPRLWPHSKWVLRTQRHWDAARLKTWLKERGGLRAESLRRHEQDFAALLDPKRSPPRMRKDGFLNRAPDYAAAMRARKGRSLLIWGENDPTFSEKASTELAAMLDRPEVHRLAQSGHYPMLDEPRVVTQLMQEFLEE